MKKWIGVCVRCGAFDDDVERTNCGCQPGSTRHAWIGTKVRYKPGQGTYGYEDAIDPTDGRVPGEVVGFTPTRVRVRFSRGHIPLRAVDATSLVLEG